LLPPIKQIASNSGMEGSEVIAEIINTVKSNVSQGLYINYGYDFLNNRYGDMLEMGVIDPVKVVRLTLENAVSVAGMLLTTEVSIAEEIEEDPVRTPKGRS